MAYLFPKLKVDTHLKTTHYTVKITLKDFNTLTRLKSGTVFPQVPATNRWKLPNMLLWYRSLPWWNNKTYWHEWSIVKGQDFVVKRNALPIENDSLKLGTSPIQYCIVLAPKTQFNTISLGLCFIPLCGSLFWESTVTRRQGIQPGHWIISVYWALYVSVAVVIYYSSPCWPVPPGIHFLQTFFKCITFNQSYSHLIRVTPNFVYKNPINDKPSLV